MPGARFRLKATAVSKQFDCNPLATVYRSDARLWLGFFVELRRPNRYNWRVAFYADLHVHSKFARATSADSDLEHMALWAARKGVLLLGTGDFTHPGWWAEIQAKLVPAEPGLFRLTPEWERWVNQQLELKAEPVRFILQVEIATIYKKADRTRKVHHCIYVPDFQAAQRLSERLARIGNLGADGRPILGLDSRDLLELVLETSSDAFLIPAHIWTPWFAVLGSKSGFDSIAECYGDLAPHIFALETGLSSDPPMNWRLSALDRFTLVSNSDAHSPARIGREACVFDCGLGYFAVREALRTRRGWLGTIEFFPEEGKYHLDGHRQCGVCLRPEATRAAGGLCPACGKELTVGVMHRVTELADRPEGFQPPDAPGYRSLVPLEEVLAEIYRVGRASRQVREAYHRLLNLLGPELYILDQAPLEDLSRADSALLAEAVARMRQGRVVRQAGYDGQYGVIRLFRDDELAQGNPMSVLFHIPAAAGHEAEPVRGLRKPACCPAASEALSGARPTGGAGADRPQPARGAKAPDRSRVAPGSDGARSELWTAGSFRDGELPLAADPLAGLDPEQRAAATAPGGPLLIIAGPGTGKTRTLTHRLAHLILNCGVAPESVLAVTFTHRAAAEMQDRLHKLVPRVAERVWVTTFHGLGWRLLRQDGAALGLPATLRILATDQATALVAETLKISRAEARRRRTQLQLLRRRLAAGAEADRTGSEADLQALAAYQQACRSRGWLEFDDLIELAVALLENHPPVRQAWQQRFGWIAVDEFQDIDARQYRLIQLLAGERANLSVIGDPDQSIYGFRGAAPTFFERFLADFPGARTIQLRRNYRSSPAIVQAALQAIAPASLVPGRQLEALRADPTRITIHEAATDKAEAEFVVHTIEQLIGGHSFFSMDSRRVGSDALESAYGFSDFAVLYRTEAQADLLCEALSRSGIPYQRHAHDPLIEAAPVAHILEAARQMSSTWSVWDRLQGGLETWRSQATAPNRLGPESAATAQTTRTHAGPIAEAVDPEARARTDVELARWSDWVARLADLARGCGHDWTRFESELALRSEVDLWDARADRVSLLTLHASKGLEFAVVFIVGCEDGLLPLRFGAELDQAELAEERRLFFVGMTRARERLFLCHARKRFWRGQVRTQTVSPFIQAIEQALLELSQGPVRRPAARPTAEQLDLFG